MPVRSHHHRRKRLDKNLWRRSNNYRRTDNDHLRQGLDIRARWRDIRRTPGQKDSHGKEYIFHGHLLFDIEYTIKKTGETPSLSHD